MDIEYQVTADVGLVTFDQTLKLSILRDGQATASMEMQDMPLQGDSDQAISRLADYLMAMSLALSAPPGPSRVIPVYIDSDSFSIVNVE
jgi:hypothetical protein